MKEEIKFLKELQEELKTQSTDYQAAPRFWVLKDYRREMTTEDYADIVTIVMPGSDFESYEIKECIEMILEDEYYDLDEKQIADFKELVENDYDTDELIDWVRENCDDEAFVGYEKEVSFIVPNTLFLTKAEALEHINLYGYNYSDKVHTYAMTALRAPKVEKLLKLLETFDWDSIQSIKTEKYIDELEEQCSCMSEVSFSCGMKCSRCGREL